MNCRSEKTARPAATAVPSAGNGYGTSWRDELVLAAAIVAGLAWAGPAAAQAVPAKPEAGGFKMGIEPWLGYGLWHVAAEKKLFEAQGLSDVEIVNFTQDKDVNAALASGQLDGANIATHTALVMAAAGLPIKIVAVLDVSMTADAILAGADIKSIADLKGKEVAYEEGTTSHILLNYALAANGLTLADVKSVPMPASDAGAALIAKRVPVAVTYEPYLTLARAQDPAVRLLVHRGRGSGPGLRRLRGARGGAEGEAGPDRGAAARLAGRP